MVAHCGEWVLQLKSSRQKRQAAVVAPSNKRNRREKVCSSATKIVAGVRIRGKLVHFKDLHVARLVGLGTCCKQTSLLPLHVTGRAIRGVRDGQRAAGMRMMMCVPHSM